jgi:hypothetical protein
MKSRVIYFLLSILAINSTFLRKDPVGIKFLLKFKLKRIGPRNCKE